MAKNNEIPQKYMTVGEIAKRMNTTVRTLQHYDKEGLLPPSAESEGGRRLYTDKDVVRLHQIQSMKYLGFSLADIKHRLVQLETPEDVAKALDEQATAVREKMANLAEVLEAIEKLRDETLMMQTVDFNTYASIVVNLQMKNEFYGLVKYFNDETLDYLHSHFTLESGTAMMDTMNRLLAEGAMLQQTQTPPESKQGQAFAKAWWDAVTAFCGGDMNRLSALLEMGKHKEAMGEKWQEKWSLVEPFVSKALGTYFTNLGINPMEGTAQ